MIEISQSYAKNDKPACVCHSKRSTVETLSRVDK